MFLQSEQSAIRKQLLNDFLPDNVCPLGVQNVDISGQIASLSSKDCKSEEEVIPVDYPSHVRAHTQIEHSLFQGIPCVFTGHARMFLSR